MKIAVIGATGMVGKVMLKVLNERRLPITELLLAASNQSAGEEIKYQGKNYPVISLKETMAVCPDIALFSAGEAVSLEWAPKFASIGTAVIDNSSAWRMDTTKKLIVPEINAGVLTVDDRIIANPNCSTIQLLVAIAPLHRAYGVKRIVVSTYQSITGSGVKAVRQLENEYKGNADKKVYPHPIHQNALPQCDSFLENDYTKEEMKLVNETRKILNDDSIGITATAIRIPVVGGHGESVNIEFKKEFGLAGVRKLLDDSPGVVVQDNPSTNTYPMPIYAKGRDEVFVGRIRKDFSQKNALNLWIVADNLRKGAATNAVQIAEYLIEKGLI